ncbi:S-adenosylmethionine:tRNA ribosyltransferase-isomerase [Clostridia bacterium]|nr:S-adenosylmethionine:tRNA ribosyltransferase-isomerase [Clostridia bacterium]
MNTSDFDFLLPAKLIAQSPLEKRDESRLLLLDKNTGEIRHQNFYQVIEQFSEGDCLVLNNTRVIPARLFGRKQATQAKVEFLLLKEQVGDIWECLVKPGKKAKVGDIFSFFDERGKEELRAEILDIDSEGSRMVHFIYSGIFLEVLERLGQMPLPPYIFTPLTDKERYQTVYAKDNGSAAAPTAGLHFTEELLKKIRDHGVEIAYVTLHVGLGTFRPVKVKNVSEHHMHKESFVLTPQEAKKINLAKEKKKKVIAVGTTTCRTLESVVGQDGLVCPKTGETDIFIYPGYTFCAIDALITNFHLPQSTLLMLVSALAGKENLFKAYEEAIKEKYRFFSFGDAMYIADLKKS